MGFAIEIRQFEVDKCPHCGKPIIGTMIDWTESSGPVWRDFLKDIGYYRPYDKRNPCNDWYGKDMVLTVEQIKKLDSFSRTYDVYGKKNICTLAEEALKDGYFIAINANW